MQLGKTRKPRRTKAQIELERRIERIIGANIQGVQIPILKLSEISDAAEAAAEAGEDIEAAVKEAVARVRTN